MRFKDQRKLLPIKSKPIIPKVFDQTIYADGGCIKKNPSSIGITYAWCLVNAGHMVQSGSGVIPNYTTNNEAEFLAVLHALESMPDNWRGIVYSDSKITLAKFGQGRFESEYCQPFKDRAQSALARIHKEVVFRYTPGHVARKNLTEHSLWQTWCDSECKNQAQQYYKEYCHG